MKLGKLIDLLSKYNTKFSNNNILQILCDTDSDDNVQLGFGNPNYNQDKESSNPDKEVRHEYLVVNKVNTKKCLGSYPLIGLAENVIKSRSDSDNWTIMELDVSEY